MASAWREFIPEGEGDVALTEQAAVAELWLADVQVLGRKEALGKHLIIILLY